VIWIEGEIWMTLPKKRNKTNLIAKRFAKPPALKHGIYASIEILPWEDPNLFEELRNDLWEEHKPEGPSQEECVETILTCQWRKKRLRTWRKLETAVALERAENHVFGAEPPPLFDTRHESVIFQLSNRSPSDRSDNRPSDDYAHLLMLSRSFYGDQHSDRVKWSLMMLPLEFRDHLKKQVPESNFETTQAWIIAIKKEVDTVLLPMVKNRRPDPKGYKAAAAEFLTPDRMIEDLEIEEKLDAQMDRALRRLFWLKTQKELEREKAQKLINGKVSPSVSR
jgi:hypothetical protein